MKRKQAIERICDILEHPEYIQIRAYLATYNEDGKIDGKCALGEISCGVGLKLSRDKNNPTYTNILEKAGIPQWMLKDYN